MRILALIALFGGANRPPGRRGANSRRNEGASNDEEADLPQRAKIVPQLIGPAAASRPAAAKPARYVISPMRPESSMPVNPQQDRRAVPVRR